MPKTTVFLRMASTYFFWPRVLGLMERPRAVRTASPNTWEGRAPPSSSSPRMMSMERPTVSAVRASPRSSRVMSSSKSRATRSASVCSPVMVISLPRTKTVLSKAASISFSSSSRVPRRLTIEWFPGTSTLTWTCVGCCTLAVCPSVRGRHVRPTVGGRRIPEYSEPWDDRSGGACCCRGGPPTIPVSRTLEGSGGKVRVDVGRLVPVPGRVLSGRPVAQEHDSGMERPGLGQPQPRDLGPFGEQPPAASEDDRVHEQPVLVDQPGRDERVHQGDAAGGDDVVAR